ARSRRRPRAVADPGGAWGVARGARAARARAIVPRGGAVLSPDDLARAVLRGAGAPRGAGDGRRAPRRRAPSPRRALSPRDVRRARRRGGGGRAVALPLRSAPDRSRDGHELSPRRRDGRPRRAGTLLASSSSWA